MCGDVAEGETLILGGMTPEKELGIFKQTKGPTSFNFWKLGIDPRVALFCRTAIDLTGKQTEPGGIPKPSMDRDGDMSDNQQLQFGMKKMKEKEGYYVVDSPNSKLLTGFSEELNSDDVKLQVQWNKTRLGWATISVVSMTGNGFDPAKAGSEPIRILVTATGLMQNTDMVLEKLDGTKITVGNRWGKEPVLCEGIPLSLRFDKAKSLTCYPLDENGNRRDVIKTNGNTVELGPQYKTIWYELELRQ